MVVQDVCDVIRDTLEQVGVTATSETGEGLEPPYVVVQSISGRSGVTTIEGARGRRTFDVPLQLVGHSARSIRWLSDRIEQALLGVRLQVTGCVVAPADRILSIAASVQHDVQPAQWWATDIYRVEVYPTRQTPGGGG